MKDPWPRATQGHIFSADHREIPRPVWWCQQTVRYGIRYFLFLCALLLAGGRIRSSVCLHPSSFYSCWSALFSIRSCSLLWRELWSAGLLGWSACKAGRGCREPGPRLTQVTLELEARAAFTWMEGDRGTETSSHFYKPSSEFLFKLHQPISPKL